jgi:ribosome-binding factor A
MSHRVEKIESTLARALQQVIARGLADPRAGGLISVTKVDVSPDLKQATIFVSIFPEQKQKLTMHALAHAAGHLRRQTGELMHIKRMPEFVFKLDTTLKEQAELLNAMHKASESTNADRPSGWGTGGAQATGARADVGDEQSGADDEQSSRGPA